ncbi:MAG: single-stranded-DNA-specific exonuclease RecJ [Cyanobacteria bacterium SID2]|nr:single-stranded-DNA-specific exonuclease RecJ [Cyanobacteria bacterium SID2]
MSNPARIWSFIATDSPPSEFVRSLQKHTVGGCGRLAVLLWSRNVRDPNALPGFLDWRQYRPTGPFEFADEMQRAVRRLTQAIEGSERVAIWGDFDADGVTATSVLWDGLGQFFDREASLKEPRDRQLTYVIPNRFTDSHGLNRRGLQALADDKISLVVTCDTGSTNLEELAFAQELGIDVIVTDHHTLPEVRPPVVSIVNPRYFPEDHPLYSLSGVAVAYKLVEALYEALPEIPQQPLEHLLDLVAIGLIADLVELRGDCRYLAQRGIEQLQKQLVNSTRPGLAQLLQLCKRTGDRPTDISFGIGPRINAVSRIHGDASFCVELLTSRDEVRCKQLAGDAELANARRKELQNRVTNQVKAKLAACDLSTTCVIVLSDPQWEVGVLGLVAGQIAQEYGRPTILLCEEVTGERPMARGSARSIDRIDLYRLVKSQAHLLDRFGGHPFAAGLSLPVENLHLFAEAIDRELAQQLGGTIELASEISIDLTVTVSELGKDLFKELKCLEPCGMGNPPPRLLVRDCWFENVWNKNIKDRTGRKVRYIRTGFELWDKTVEKGFPGVWWEHYQDELPNGRCDAIVELDFNTYDKRYEVRLIDVRLVIDRPTVEIAKPSTFQIFDWRQISEIPHPHPPLLQSCPSSWGQLQRWFRQVRKDAIEMQGFALAYSEPEVVAPEALWQQLVGIAKYLSRTGKVVTKQQFYDKLNLSDRTLEIGFSALRSIGFTVDFSRDKIRVFQSEESNRTIDRYVTSFFFEAIREEQFRRHYFSTVSTSILRSSIAY